MNFYTLIKNHINIGFDNNNIYFESLLSDKDFEYFKDASINRYQDYPEFYNFLFEIKSLLEQDLAFIEDGKVIISNDDFINLEFEDKFKLTLKEQISFSIKIRDKSCIQNEDFHFDAKILDERYKDVTIIGCFAIKNDKFYLLNNDLYTLYSAMNIIANIPFNDENRESKIWALINDLKEKSPLTNSVLTGFFKNENIIIPSGMTFDIKEDENHNFEMLTQLCGLSQDENLEFNSSFKKLIDVPNTYSLNVNGQTTRIVLSPELKENYKTIKKSPQKIRREKDKNLILKNPTAIFKYPEVVSLENFSDRVIDFGLYKFYAGHKSNSDISWNYPYVLKLIGISGQEITIVIEDKNQKEEFSRELNDSIENENAYFKVDDNLIPLSETNLQVLKPFIHIEDQSNNDNIDQNEDKVLKKIHLKDIQDQIVAIDLTASLFTMIKSQIELIRSSMSDTDISINKKTFTINNQEFPLTMENLKQIIKVLEIHLIIDEDANINEIDEEKKTLNEILMANYCIKNQPELPKDLKEYITTLDGRKIPLSLKSHQLKGLAWMQNSYKMKEIGRNGILLADDMGLGKTLQLLSFMFWLKDIKPNYFNSNNNKPILIVAPVILLENWKNEYYRFFNDSLGKPLILHGDSLRKLRNDDGTFTGREYYQMTENMSAPKAYLDVEKIKEYNLVITNYDTLANYEFSLGSIDWSLVILDEAQEIKEGRTGKSKVAKTLKTDFKIASTGTPVENSLMDLWNIFNFLQPEVLGTSEEYKQNFQEKNMEIADYKRLQDKFYYDKSYAYILRRTKNIELKDALPSKHIEKYTVPLSEFQVSEFAKLKAEMIESSCPLDVLNKMNKLSQHPYLLDKRFLTSSSCNSEELIDNCPKFKKLLEILTTIKQKNEKAIIFCLFHELQRFLKLVIEDYFNLENVEIINGSSSGTSSRQHIIDKFQQQRDNFDVLILSPLAAGVGLTITGANHVIHYGRWWNPAKENQATDRVYRIGQEKEVFVHYLIDTIPNSSVKTFDENLHELVTSKIEMANNFLEPNDFDIRDGIINVMSS